ncbi:MAG: hypothetical protein ALAOOOJD_02027 [bacterium]|nr:hypothetical protein [bacterium]
MARRKFIRALLLVMLPWASMLPAQSSNLMNKLALEPSERIGVWEVGMEKLVKIIEATAWKMNYDSIVVNAGQDKMLIFRSFPPAALQYRILLGMAPMDSAVQLTGRGFWFLPPDSIPRYSRAMKSADRDLLKLFLYAVTQEIVLQQAAPLFTRTLPARTFPRFMGWNLLNPGLASWYLMKDHPRTTRKSALAWSIAFGLLDVGYIALGFAPDGAGRNDRQDESAPFINLSNRQMSLFGAITFRAAMTIGYFVDKDYAELQKSGYYFPKIAQINFNTKYTKFLPPAAGEKQAPQN